MTEKYKIYLSEDTRARLINDAELFEFTKKDGSVNLNAFIKTLIVNYFDQYRHDSEYLLSGSGAGDIKRTDQKVLLLWSESIQQIRGLHSPASYSYHKTHQDFK